MRRQLLWSTLAAVAVALVLVGLPLAVAVRTLLTDSARDRLQAELEQTQVILTREGVTPGATGLILRILAEDSGDRFTLLDSGGRVVLDAWADPMPRGAALQAPDVRLARGGQPAWHQGSGFLAVSAPVTIGGQPLILRVAESDLALHRKLRQAWLAIAGLALAALSVAALLARYQGRRLAMPLEHLAGSARRLGDGDFTARAPRSGLAELDDVADALDTTAGRLGTMLERSRSFGADASHQLRTPLTALRLDLEALESSGADPELLAAAMVEADRLEATITELLALAEPPLGDELVDVATLANERLDAWQALARAQDREVVLSAAPVPPVRARAAALGQSLQVLLDNALEHGRGTITIRVQQVVPRPGSNGNAVRPHGVRLCVTDEGPGFPPGAENLARSGDHANGRGLPLARSLVEAEGGRLLIERPPAGADVCLLLPAAGPP